ncbi:MAG: carbohydrate-binding domain-containing protein [Candidatus Nomurabacteria bacterium]|jgi:hypothetical protein|nr:carbohydrate-binding domain-containing protein [Candidatus Nomurabacteria bacterium]
MAKGSKKVLLGALGGVALFGVAAFFIFFYGKSATITNTPIAAANFDAADEKTAISADSQLINLADYADGAVVEISSAGEYVLSGKMANGQIVVEVGDEEKVQLYLDNVEIVNPAGSAILVSNAKKVIITLNDGTTNIVTDGATSPESDAADEPDAAIFAHDDLTINGTGALVVNAKHADGIESRDDLKIAGGEITVSAADNGLFGNKSVETKTATLTISSGGDAVHSDGDLIIESGSFVINAGDDGMHADGTLTINAGTIDIKESFEGIEATDIVVNGGNISVVASDDGLNGAGGNDDNSSSPTTSSGRGRDNFRGNSGSITVTGGTLFIAAAGSGTGDGFDANGDITITGGDIVIKTPSSFHDYGALDADGAISITSGTVRSLSNNGVYSELNSSSSNGGGGGRR